MMPRRFTQGLLAGGVSFTLLAQSSSAALLFDASTERVDHGSATSLDDLDTATVLAWVYPTATSVGFVEGKYASPCCSTGYRWLVPGFHANASLDVRVDRATSDLGMTALSLMTANAWQFIGAVWNTGGTDADQKLFRGTLTSIATEPTYNIQTVGSGATVSDAGGTLVVGNREGADFNFPGRIAWVGIWNRALTNGEVRAQQFRPHPTSGCVLFTHYGFNGTGTQPDWSGSANSGTVTGATVIDHVPLGAPFGFDLSSLLSGRWLDPFRRQGQDGISRLAAAMALVSDTHHLTIGSFVRHTSNDNWEGPTDKATPRASGGRKATVPSESGGWVAKGGCGEPISEPNFSAGS